MKAYGAGQWRYSYQGHDIIEHGGYNPGYKTQVARFPDDNLGIISLSNDGNGGFLMEAVKLRIADELLGLKEIDWNERCVFSVSERFTYRRQFSCSDLRNFTMISSTRQGRLHHDRFHQKCPPNHSLRWLKRNIHISRMGRFHPASSQTPRGKTITCHSPLTSTATRSFNRRPSNASSTLPI